MHKIIKQKVADSRKLRAKIDNIITDKLDTNTVDPKLIELAGKRYGAIYQIILDSERKQHAQSK